MHQVLAGVVRDGELKPRVHDRCGKRAVTGPAGGEQCFQAITGSVVYLGHVTHYYIGYVVNKLARAMFKPSTAHMAAVKHLPGHFTGTTTTCKQGYFKLPAFSDTNWGNNPNRNSSRPTERLLRTASSVSRWDYKG